ncbi:MAG: CPBP family intramembrane glutamic endopeptidase [Flavobacteriales bacterium]
MMQRRVLSFLALAFGFTWAVAGIGALLGIDATSGGPYLALAAVCMFGPAIAALVQHRHFDHAPWKALGLHPELIRWPFLFAAASIGLCIVPLTLLVINLLGDGLGYDVFGHVEVSGSRFNIAMGEMVAQMGGNEMPNAATEFLAGLPGGLILAVLLFSGLFSAFSINLPFMLGEELGWRGYLYQALAGWSAGRRILFTGVVWGLWHAPLIAMGHNYPGHPVLGIGLMVVFCILLAFLFDWARTRANSVWAPAVLHGVINGTASSVVFFSWDGDVLFGSPVGVAGFIAIAFLALLVLGDGTYRKGLMQARNGVAQD